VLAVMVVVVYLPRTTSAADLLLDLDGSKQTK